MYISVMEKPSLDNRAQLIWLPAKPFNSEKNSKNDFMNSTAK